MDLHLQRSLDLRLLVLCHVVLAVVLHHNVLPHAITLLAQPLTPCIP